MGKSKKLKNTNRNYHFAYLMLKFFEIIIFLQTDLGRSIKALLPRVVYIHELFYRKISLRFPLVKSIKTVLLHFLSSL